MAFVTDVSDVHNWPCLIAQVGQCTMTISVGMQVAGLLAVSAMSRHHAIRY